MLQYINHARKLAYQEDAHFYFATKVNQIEETQSGYVLRCDAKKFVTRHRRGFDQVLVGYDHTDEMVPMNIWIDGVGSNAFRLRYSLAESFDNHTLMAPKIPKADKKSICETEKTYRIDNQNASLEISKQCMEITLMDKEGNVLLHIPGIDACYPNCEGAGGYSSLKDFFPFGVNEKMCTFTSKLSLNEKIYGLGERFTDIDRRGEHIEFYHQDAAGNEGQLTYKNIPFYMSNQGYGVFVNSSALMDYDIGMKNYDFSNIFVEDQGMDLFLIAGPQMADVLKGYCDITGYAPALPRWSYGLWMSRNSYQTKDIAFDVAKQLREKQIPCDVIHLDTYWFKNDWACDLLFDEERFSQPEQMMKEFEKMGFTLSLWQLPMVHPDLENYQVGKENDYFIKKQDGTIYHFHWFGRYYAMIDYSNPDAIEWYLKQIENVLRMGAKVIKTDMPENCPSDGVYHDIEAKKMHNLFPLIYNKVIYERTKKVHGEGIVWARSSYAGGQRYPLHWSGDARSTFENMAGALRSGLSIGFSGHPFWSHDIGGFIGRPTKELYIRWAQFGLFSSHARCHGGGNTNPREPWAYGKEAEKIFKKYADMRYELLPYIFSVESECCNTGLPFIRHMIFHHQSDLNTHGIYDQYYFGKNMLVCPMLTMENKRSVYLPEGIWYDFETGKKQEKTGWIEVEVPLDKIQIYVPAGAIIVKGPKMQYVDEKKIDQLEIHIYAGKTSTFEYVNGDGKVTFTNQWKEGKAQFDDGGYSGKYQVIIHG